ncbi:hypothetical protein ACFPH6_10270 [Streptomyces xiangluensis]|uniref:Nucleotide exchange factor GrpE n=1 Tax=Streptomyces xiangluensis TaxID=2665720 RepID=A0ABV8YL04_9ACTN
MAASVSTRITERPRSVPDGSPPLPQRLVHQLLADAERDRGDLREQARARAVEERERYARLAADIASALHELRGFLAATPSAHAPDLDGPDQVLAAVARRFASALTQAGVHLDDPLGRTYAEVAPYVDVGHAPAAGAASELVIGRTVRPGVRLHDGTWIRRAQVLLEPRKEPGEQSRTKGEERA